MRIAGQLLLEGDHEHARLAPGAVTVRDGAIVSVDEGDADGPCELGGPDCLISPGFIDAHVHLPQFDTIGAHGLPLLDWLDGVTFPAERRWVDADYAAGMTRRVARQLVRHGTTAVCAYSSVHAAATAAAIATLEQSGVRGAVGQAMSDRHAPDDLVGATHRLLDETAALLERRPASGRVAAAITPRFAVSCSGDLLAGAGRLAAEHPQAVVQTHLSETLRECELVSELFDGQGYVEVYRRAGLLTPRSLMGHAIHLSDEERTTLRDAGAVAAHCPTANSFLRSGAMAWATARSADQRIALGSDIGGGYERSMVRVARAMVETASAIGEPYPSARHAWWSITAGNADATGLNDAGRLVVGAPADLVVVRPDVPWLDPPVDPLATLLWSWDDRWIDAVVARGEAVVGSNAA